MSDSLIINYIMDHPHSWIEDFKNMDIKVHYDGSLAIFNSGTGANFHNPIVQEARGIIIDMTSYTVVCWPFRKFGNHIESYADKIDWNSARVEEKVDGSIVKLFWWNDEWCWATNGVINAANANVSLTNMSYLDLIKKAINYKDIPFNSLNKDYTYIFELVSPYNKIVIEYPKIELYHIGTRNNIDGEEYNINIGIQKPKVYPITTFEEALTAAEALNADLNQVTAEGFVVVDKDWHRVKIKSPAYLAMHHVWSNRNYILEKKNVLNTIKTLGIQEFVDGKGPEPWRAQIYFYSYQISLLKWEIDEYIRYVRNLYEEYSHERKAVANTIKNDRLSYFGFKAIGNNLTANDLVDSLQIPQLIKYIPDFEMPSFIGEY